MSSLNQNSYAQDFIKIAAHIIDHEPISLSSGDLSIRKKRATCIVIEDGKITEMRISQSIIKKMLYKGNERPDFCPRNFYVTECTRQVEETTSDSMLGGLYFETGFLGKSADNDVIDLPRDKRTGKKRKDHERIDEAIDRAKNMALNTGLIITPRNVQVPMKELWEDPIKDRRINNVRIWLTGTADIVSPFKSDTYDIDLETAVIDVKLAKDRDECFIDKLHPWRSFPWGCPGEMDHTQAIMYSHLFKLPFVYLVFDFNPKDGLPGWKPVIVKTIEGYPGDNESRLRKEELYQNIRWVTNKILMMHEEGWQPNQCERCRKCPLNTCEYKIKTIAV